MRDFKGTKGPWRWEEDGNMILGQQGRIVFWGDNIIGGVSEDDGWAARLGAIDSDIESEANANLIAASPELLEALQELLECYESISYFSVENSQIGKKVTHVIAKALGESK